MAEPALPPGHELLRRLGHSPLSEVFLVREPGGELRALKLLRPSVAGDPRILERWRRESQLLGEIDHPNLVHSHGELEVDGRPGLLLEYVEGASLRDRLQRGPLEWEQAARIGVQVARALERLHRHGAIHRDVKPHNVLLHPRRGAVLADLGLVRRREDPTLTRQGAALGSPAYMSPEQARDPSEIGPEADVYSLGATLHHAISGKPPFLGSGVGEVIHRVLHLEPEPLPAETPEPLARVLAAAMAKDPDRRYSRAADLRADLARVLTGAAPRLLTAHRLRARRRWAGGAAAVVLLGVVGRLFLGWLPEGPGPRPAEEAAARAPEPDRPEAPPGGTALPADPPEGPRGVLRHRAWVLPLEGPWRTAMATGNLRRALEEVDLLAALPLPPEADEVFAAEHERHLRRAESEVLRRGEEVAVEAEALLEEAERAARRALSTDPFHDLRAWEDMVERAWRDRGLRVAELPLRLGGSSPRARLRQTVDRLRDLQAHALNDRAARAVPPRREEVRRLLRSGDLAKALANWGAVDRGLLGWSREGRFEDARLAALAGLDEDALYRAPLGRLRSRVAAGPSEQDWVLAHVAWCRGELETALELMRPLEAERWPPARDPAFWIDEWELELRAALAAAPRTEDGAGGAAAAPPDPLEELAARWRERIGDAEVVVRAGGVELGWTQPRWGAARSDSLPWERGQWRVAEWRLTWKLAAEAAPPRLVRWLGQVELLHPSPSSAPVLRVGEEERRGLGFQPGTPQTLEMRDGEVSLDGIPVGRVEALRGNRLVISSQADPSLTLERVWLRVVPD